MFLHFLTLKIVTKVERHNFVFRTQIQSSRTTTSCAFKTNGTWYIDAIQLDVLFNLFFFLFIYSRSVFIDILKVLFRVYHVQFLGTFFRFIKLTIIGSGAETNDLIPMQFIDRIVLVIIFKSSLTHDRIKRIVLFYVTVLNIFHSF